MGGSALGADSVSILPRVYQRVVVVYFQQRVHRRVLVADLGREQLEVGHLLPGGLKGQGCGYVQDTSPCDTGGTGHRTRGGGLYDIPTGLRTGNKGSGSDLGHAVIAQAPTAPMFFAVEHRLAAGLWLVGVRLVWRPL